MRDSRRRTNVDPARRPAARHAALRVVGDSHGVVLRGRLYREAAEDVKGRLASSLPRGARANPTYRDVDPLGGDGGPVVVDEMDAAASRRCDRIGGASVSELGARDQERPLAETEIGADRRSAGGYRRRRQRPSLGLAALTGGKTGKIAQDGGRWDEASASAVWGRPLAAGEGGAAGPRRVGGGRGALLRRGLGGGGGVASACGRGPRCGDAAGVGGGYVGDAVAGGADGPRRRVRGCPRGRAVGVQSVRRCRSEGAGAEREDVGERRALPGRRVGWRRALHAVPARHGHRPRRVPLGQGRLHVAVAGPAARARQAAGRIEAAARLRRRRRGRQGRCAGARVGWRGVAPDPRSGTQAAARGGVGRFGGDGRRSAG